MNHFASTFIALVLLISHVSSSASPYTPVSLGTQPNIPDLAKWTYDTAGNRILDSLKNQKIVFGLNGLPTTIDTAGSGIVHFKYQSKNQRYLRTLDNNKTILYIGDSEYHFGDDNVQQIIYIRNGNYSPIAQVRISNNTQTTTYAIKDHQGTPLKWVDETGQPESNARHDPWGKPVTASGIATSMQDKQRDFTGHENIAQADLIHMNARLFDPSIGAFLSPDPIVESSLNLPNLARYGYVNHRGPNGTDPTGLTITPAILPGHINHQPNLEVAFEDLEPIFYNGIFYSGIVGPRSINTPASHLIARPIDTPYLIIIERNINDVTHLLFNDMMDLNSTIQADIFVENESLNLNISLQNFNRPATSLPIIGIEEEATAMTREAVVQEEVILAALHYASRYAKENGQLRPLAQPHHNFNVMTTGSTTGDRTIHRFAETNNYHVSEQHDGQILHLQRSEPQAHPPAASIAPRHPHSHPHSHPHPHVPRP